MSANRFVSARNQGRGFRFKKVQKGVISPESPKGLPSIFATFGIVRISNPRTPAAQTSSQTNLESDLTSRPSGS